jgi:hypothetical protein
MSTIVLVGVRCAVGSSVAVVEVVIPVSRVLAVPVSVANVLFVAIIFVSAPVICIFAAFVVSVVVALNIGIWTVWLCVVVVVGVVICIVSLTRGAVLVPSSPLLLGSALTFVILGRL